MRSLCRSLSFSQDWPTAPIDPFLYIHAAVTRSHIGKDEMLGSEKNKVTPAQAIRAYTLDSAYALAAEDKDGSIEVDRLGDKAPSVPALTLPIGGR